MDVDRVIGIITAAGIELTDRRRNGGEDGWELSFSNGAVVSVLDSGLARVSGKGVESVSRLLDLPLGGG